MRTRPFLRRSRLSWVWEAFFLSWLAGHRPRVLQGVDSSELWIGSLVQMPPKKKGRVVPKQQDQVAPKAKAAPKTKAAAQPGIGDPNPTDFTTDQVSVPRTR